MASFNKLSNQKLAFLLKDGSHGAYTEIYERFFNLLYVHAIKKINDQDEARDIVQETFIVLWNKKELIDSQREIAPYLYTILRNKIIDWYSHQDVKSRYISSFQKFTEIKSSLTDYRLRENQLKALIEKEISALPPRMREVFELSRKEHLSHEEIAEKLNISKHTVKTQIKNALRILRVKLGLLVYLYLLTRL